MYQSRSFPVAVRHAWRGQVATLSRRGGWRSRVVHQHATLFPRFAAYYAQLRALPKAARRQWQRRWARSLAGVAFLLTLGHGTAQAAEFTAGTAAELNAAITTANNTAEADTITLTQDIVLTTPATTAMDGNTGTVVVKSAITLEGQGHTLSRAPGAPQFRLLRVAPVGVLTVRQTTLRGGQVNNSRGGGLLNEGSVTLEECTISGNTALVGGGVYSVTTGTSQLTLTAGTITGNYAFNVGGGVSSSTTDTSQATLTTSTITGNSAFHGGGVSSSTSNDSRMILYLSTLSGNSAASLGGGMSSSTHDDSGMKLVGSTITGNTAGFGGGVASDTYGTSGMTLFASTVSGNSATSDGGGVYSRAYDDSYLAFFLSTVSGNSAASVGGGVLSHTYGASHVGVALSTLSGNSAFAGGGVFSRTFESSQVLLVSSTITGNSANRGGGVRSGTSDSSQVTLEQMLVAGNRAPSGGAEVAQTYFSGGVFSTASNLFGHSGLTTPAALEGFFIAPTDHLATAGGDSDSALSAILDPTLADNGGPTRTHNLVPGSPAIDAAGSCLSVSDQRGFPRPQGSACDIGAVESGESCGNCVDDDGDGLVDFADPDCTTGAAPIAKERASFSLNPTPHSDQLTLTVTLPGGKEVNPPLDGLGVQFLDDQGSLLCVHLPPASAVPGAWKTKLSAGNPRTTWQFKDAPDGSLGDPSKDAGTVTFDPIKDTLTVKLTIKETEIGGDATARDITTGVGNGVSRWQQVQQWTVKAGGKKLSTP